MDLSLLITYFVTHRKLSTWITFFQHILHCLPLCSTRNAISEIRTAFLGFTMIICKNFQFITFRKCLIFSFFRTVEVLLKRALIQISIKVAPNKCPPFFLRSDLLDPSWSKGTKNARPLRKSHYSYFSIQSAEWPKAAHTARWRNKKLDRSIPNPLPNERNHRLH